MRPPKVPDAVDVPAWVPERDRVLWILSAALVWEYRYSVDDEDARRRTERAAQAVARKMR